MENFNIYKRFQQFQALKSSENVMKQLKRSRVSHEFPRSQANKSPSARQRRRKTKLIEFNGVMKIISPLLELWMAQNYITLARRFQWCFAWWFHLGLFFSRPFGAWFLWTRGNSNALGCTKKLSLHNDLIICPFHHQNQNN